MAASGSSLSRAGARALAAALEILGLTTAAHLAGGGVLPDPGIILGSAGLLFVACILALGEVVRLRVVVPVVTVAQLALHLVFSASAGTPHHGGSAGVHAVGADVGFAVGDMVAAHVLAAVATGLVLLWQQGLLRRVRQWLRPYRVALPMLPVRSMPPVPHPADRVRSRRAFLASAPRRGPPLPVLTTP